MGPQCSHLQLMNGEWCVCVCGGGGGGGGGSHEQ